MVRILEKAPDFRARAVTGRGEILDVSLADFKGKWLVLFFYPRDFTAVCPTEIVEFSKRSREFEALGAKVAGCSVDTADSHRSWIENGLGPVAIPLIADPGKEMARSYGALLEKEGVATRATCILDPDGVVQYACWHNLRVGRSVSETLRVLEALQTDERTPAGWHKGQETLGR